jgi:hypothetical protein
MPPARTFLLATLAFALAAPPAHADIFAASEGRPTGRTDFDIYLVNMSTGAQLTLPAGLNMTSADELHPSLTADGKRMVFERRSGATLRIVEIDLTTGQSADLFSGFEQAANQQITPSISPDGRTVATGEAFTEVPQVTLTDVSAFPTGPFPHSTYRTSFSFGAGTTGVTANPVISGNLIAFDEQPLNATARTVVGPLAGGTTSQPFGGRHPALGTPGGVNTVVFDVSAAAGDRDLAFNTYSAPAAAANGTTVPLAQVNTSLSENRPSFSLDGRYVAFVTHGGGATVRLNLWDSLTQTTMTAPGLGIVDAGIDGSTSVYTRPLLKTTTISVPVVRFDLLSGSGVGILVQRVVGHRRLFGRRVPALRMVGRVPLGRFKAGAGRARWDGRVGGRKLRRGTYQVTVRAVDARGHVLDLGRPRLVRISR